MKLATLLLTAFVPLGAAGQEEVTLRTVFDAVYTTGQADRGREGYESWCNRCHGGENGTEPFPGGSLARIVGCLAQTERDRWALHEATEPQCAKTVMATPADRYEAATLRPGNQQFRLVNFDYIAPDFRPEPFEGHKVLVKGYLIRQPNAERVNVTDMVSVGERCGR